MNDEDIKILEEFKEKGYHTLFLKYGDRNKTNLKIEKAIENLLKENEDLRKNSVPVAKIEEEIKHLHKNIQDIENVTLFKEKTLKEQTEIELCKYAICVLIRIWEGK